MRPGFVVALLVSAMLVMPACTGRSDDGAQGGEDKEIGVAFMASVNHDTRAWSKDAAARFFDEAVKDFARTSEIETFNTNGISRRLCDHLRSFKKQVGKGAAGGPIKRPYEAVEFAKKSAFDSAIAGLLEHALAAGGPGTEARLNALKVEAFAPNAETTKLNGTAALTQAGLLNANGQLNLPLTEYLGSGPDDAYSKYRDWLIKESPGLLKPANNLTSGIDNDLDKCASQE